MSFSIVLSADCTCRPEDLALVKKAHLNALYDALDRMLSMPIYERLIIDYPPTCRGTVFYNGQRSQDFSLISVRALAAFTGQYKRHLTPRQLASLPRIRLYINLSQ